MVAEKSGGRLLDQNPYAAPTADVYVRPARDERAWFAVGTRKLLVMSLLSFDLYIVYWFERQYRFQKRAQGESTMPLARGLFFIIFAHDVFRRVEVAAHKAGVGHGWRAGGLTGVFIVSALLSRIFDSVSSKLTGRVSVVLGLVSIVLALGVAYPLVQVQGTLNEVLDRTNPGTERNESFTIWNWLLMILGVGLLAMGLIGSFLPG
jgi:hypothetical protein